MAFCSLIRNFAHMKPAQIFNQYIWIINTLRAYRKLTLEQLNQKWQDDGVADGNPLQRSSFNRHRDAILDMFGIIIDCGLKTYKYYIGNPEVLLNDGSISQWLFSTLAHDAWRKMAKSRNTLSHVYDEEEVLPIVKLIYSDYAPLLKKLDEELNILSQDSNYKQA